MPVGELCTRQTVVVPLGTSLSDAAKLMREYHVGDLVVIERTDGKRRPVGIVTDRDIVMEVLAQDLDPARLSVEDIMTRDPVTVQEQDGLFETMRIMRANGIRRIPVVDGEGALAGIVAVDDLIELLAEELSLIAKVIVRERRQEAEVRT
jgi:CBS domain-containing protein